ncbi:AAA family ATPase [Actinosynnema sp. NPDC053489]|uniref:AAA family ATPase n=1 Tax=Actinosynnema sp. NPDC053489 TaxID=3363916 RepID=UPI0037C5037A
MTDFTDMSQHLEEMDRLLEEVDHSAKSITKYRPFEHYLARLLELHPDLIYTAYISKAGNASVRFDQSKRSRNARLLVALVEPPPHEPLTRSIAAIERYKFGQRPDAEVLVLTRRLARWRPQAAIVGAHSQHLLEPFAQSLPDFIVIGQSDDLFQVESPPLQRGSELSFVVRNPGESIPRAGFPLAVLTRDEWDDDGLRTMFSLVLFLGANDEIDIGEVKILRKNQPSGETPVPSRIFDKLGNEYCSLGQSYAYYDKVNTLPTEIAVSLLRALRDVIFNPNVRNTFRSESGFMSSVARTNRAKRLLTHPPFSLLRDTDDIVEESGFGFTFNTNVGGKPFAINFNFGGTGELPDRVNAVIGYNGTGKTQLLANIALVATSDTAQRKTYDHVGTIASSGTVVFSSVIAISYSAFDTFVLPDAFWKNREGELARERLEETGEVFGYAYCGLRKWTPEQESEQQNLSSNADADGPFLHAPRGLKTIDELTDEYARALSLIRSKKRSHIVRHAVNIIREEPSFGRIGLDPLFAVMGDDWREYFDHMSTGHKIALNIIVQMIGHSDQGSLVLIDEPESHLHPSLLAALMRAISETLSQLNSYAVVATHSPVVLQEIPRRHVRILRRFGQQTEVANPLVETFGENVGYLTTNIFDLDSTKTDYHAALEKLAQTKTIEEIEALFDGDMSMQARAYVLRIQRRRRK